jgi:pilus assembly protein CpaB
MAADPDRTRRTTLAIVAMLVSVFLAGGAVYAVAQVLAAYQDQLRQTEEAHVVRLIQVPVAVHTIGVGDVIEAADLKVVELAADYVAATAITQVEDLVGRTVVERLLAGDLVRIERLAPPASGQGLSALIPNGMRAISLDMTDDRQVSGFIEPGDGVDLLVTLPPDEVDAARVSETLTLVQGAKVLAVNEKISETVRGEGIKSQRVTLAISPDVVERVTHALEVGQAKLTLRSCIDMTQIETNGVVSADLIGSAEKRVTVAEFKERYSEADVERMIDVVMGRNKVRERVIDPRLIRDISVPEPTRSP